jgi:Uma2 family endonuclease
MIQTAKLSVAEYHQIVEMGILGDRRIELLEGELIELSPETPYHANCNNKAYKYLLSRFDGLADVRSGHPITLLNSEPEPDIVLARLPETLYDTRHPYPEDIFLLIEVSDSTLDYDLAPEKQSYAKAGIAEYWIIDLKNHQLLIFRQPADADYANHICVSTGTVAALAFPQIQIQVERLVF